MEGTRQVFTYVELITDNDVQEYINDELISSHPNPLGEIPIVHIPNRLVSSSPWGLSDISDIIGLNRQYNETATALGDIISYHSAPTTIVVGAKANQLEAGAKKVWSIPSKDAQVYNLEMQDPATLAQAFLDRLKQAMHEMTGIPVTALGQEQAVSNTSGVALQVQFQPTMARFLQKTMLYGAGFEKINYLALRTMVLKEPEILVYDPSTSPPLQEWQLPILDARDPNTYRTKAHFPSPLPIDKLIKVNEIMAMMQLGLQSKRGALQELGDENPDEKLEELMAELMQDAKWQGALDWLRAEIADVIGLSTFSGAAAMGGDAQSGAGVDAGQPTSAGGANVTSAGGPGVTPAGGAPGAPVQPLPGVQPDSETKQLLIDLSNLAQGTKLAQRRMPDSNSENDRD